VEPFVYTMLPGEPGLFYLTNWMRQFPGLTAGITSRVGGVSAAPYTALNMGLHVADQPEHVVENRRRTAEAVGAPLAHWVYGEQIHGCEVAVVGAQDQGSGTQERETELKGRDAFVTGERGIVLAALFADCVPLFFLDPVTGAIGLAHAGWKGTAAAIAARTVEAMARQFGSKPEQLQAVIGPSIGACCYEVDDRVIAAMDRVLDEVLPKLSESDGPERRKAFYQPVSANKFMLNLQQVNRQIMIKAGIAASSIEITERCTSCGTDRFYSHRKEAGHTGRMAAWIGYRPGSGITEVDLS
jgi:YfiH family protein